MFQVIPSVWAFYTERNVPFAAGRETAAFIREHFSDATPVVMGRTDLSGPSLCGYLGRPVYCLRSKKFATFVDWKALMDNEPNPYNKLKELQSAWKCDMVVLFESYAFDWLSRRRIRPARDMDISVLAEFDQTVSLVDQYEVLFLRYHDPSEKFVHVSNATHSENSH